MSGSAKHILSCIHLTMQHHVMAISCALGILYIYVCMCVSMCVSMCLHVYVCVFVCVCVRGQ